MPIVIYSLFYMGDFIVKNYYETMYSLIGFIPLSIALAIVNTRIKFNYSYLLYSIYVILAVDVLTSLIYKSYFSTIGIFVLAFSEELFFRFYLETELNEVFPRVISR